MELSDIIFSNAIFLDLRPNSKRQLIQELSSKASVIFHLDEQVIFETLLQREKLGSTGVGNGVAIPHGKVANIEKISGVFVKLNTPVDFDAIDDQPVDIIFMLLAPEGAEGAGAEHLKALSKIARLLRDSQYLQELRLCQDSKVLYDLLIQDHGTVTAA